MASDKAVSVFRYLEGKVRCRQCGDWFDPSRARGYTYCSIGCLAVYFKNHHEDNLGQDAVEGYVRTKIQGMLDDYDEE